LFVILRGCKKSRKHLHISNPSTSGLRIEPQHSPRDWSSRPQCWRLDTLPKTPGGGAVNFPGGADIFPGGPARLPGGAANLPGGVCNFPGGAATASRAETKFPGGPSISPAELAVVARGLTHFPGGLGDNVVVANRHGIVQLPGGALWLVARGLLFGAGASNICSAQFNFGDSGSLL